jgi:ribosomal protein S18 acetylase RimI-like enzyme
MPGVTIRAAGPADVEAYALLAGEFEAYLTAIDPAGEGPPRADHAAAFLRDACSEAPWFHCLLAEDGGAPLGFLSYYFGYWPERAAGTLFITDLFVREAARGRGVGRALMAEAARILDARGGTLVMWAVWDINHPAMRFYESLGAAYMDEERLMSLPVSHWRG